MQRVAGRVVALAACLMVPAVGLAKKAVPCKPSAAAHLSEKGLRGLVMAPNGKSMVVGNVDGTVLVLNTRKLKVTKTLKGHKGEVYSVAMNPNGRMAASGADDKSIMLWDLKTGKNLATLSGHLNSVRGLAFSPDGKALYSVSLDRQLGSWDVKERKLTGFLGGQACILMALAVGNAQVKGGGSAAATACNDGLVRLWDLDKGKPRYALEGHTGEVHAVAFAPVADHAPLASGDNDGKVIIWDLAANTSVKEMDAGWTDALAFSPDGTLLVGAGNDMAQKGLFRLWDVGTGELLNEQFPHDGNITGTAFSPNGRTLYTVGMDGWVRAFDVARLKKGCG